MSLDRAGCSTLLCCMLQCIRIYVCKVQAQCMHDPCSLWSYHLPVSYLRRLCSSKASMASTRCNPLASHAWSGTHCSFILPVVLLWFDVLQELDLEGSNEETGRQLCALMTTLADFHWAQVDSVQKQHAILKYVSHTCVALQNCFSKQGKHSWSCAEQCSTVQFSLGNSCCVLAGTCAVALTC
jgi:hypothetical protein